ncbi:hypothetical protein [Microtetraspora malaysiensis]|uniref:hypothetical protein n=1 Tax=Microtetraspora malaysiensis TaxID=161358 RepID=UPI003D94D284
MGEPLVTVDEFAARWPDPLTEAERERVGLLLSDASCLVREEARPVCVCRKHAPFAVRQLVMDLAGRQLSNPNGITSETVGDYSYQRARGSAVGMRLTPDERSELFRALYIPEIASVPMASGFPPARVEEYTPVGVADGESVNWNVGVPGGLDVANGAYGSNAGCCRYRHA